MKEWLNFRKKEENLAGAATWESREPFFLGKEHFELQFEFANELAKKRNISFFESIKMAAPLLQYALNEKGGLYKGFKNGVTNENIVEIARNEYLSRESKDPVQYHNKGTKMFGCFAYENVDKNTVGIHFSNAEFDKKSGPLDISKIEQRKKEIYDVLSSIKSKYPKTREITGLSWLYNLNSYRRLFPESYVLKLRPDTNESLWSRGSIWGQFIDSNYNVKGDSAKVLIQRLKELPPDRPLFDILEKGAPLFAPLSTHAPIEDFYVMYNLK